MNARLIRTLAAGALALASFASLAAGETLSGTWEETKTYTHEQKKEAVAEGKKLIAAIDKKIAEANVQVKKASAETKAAHKENMKDLQAKKKAAQAKLSEVGKASATAWDATKKGFGDAYKDLKDAAEKSYAAVAGKK